MFGSRSERTFLGVGGENKLGSGMIGRAREWEKTSLGVGDEVPGSGRKGRALE